MLMAKKKSGYSISVVAAMYEVHPQTLRAYERQGLLKPSRTEGNTRLYSDKDVERLELILTLTRELGVNLAGVEVILNMREKMEQMQKDVEECINYLQVHLGEDSDLFQQQLKDALVPLPPSKVIRLPQDDR